jgi:hypothetical protein
MKWLSNSHPVRRFAGVVSALLRLGLCLMGFAGSQPRLLADVPSLFLTNSSVPGFAANLEWDPSPDGTVVGYFLCWGIASGQCTNQLDAGITSSATVGGFTTDTTYYFNVVAYNGIGKQADPSNEVQCSMPNSASPAGTRINIQPNLGGTNLTAISLSFRGSAGTSYALLATQDLVHWDTIWTTNCVSDLTIVCRSLDVTNYASRFFRLVQRTDVKLTLPPASAPTENNRTEF